MLTHLRQMHQASDGVGIQVTHSRNWKGIVTFAILSIPMAAFGQGGPANSQQYVIQQLPVRGPQQQPVIQQVQGTPQSARALHHLIEDLPQSQEELEIIQQRSQLIVTREPIRTAAIADAGILELVQYSPKQFALVGLGLGSTTLTLWFEGRPEPLIFTVKTIRDPNLDYQRKLDYGKLERRLATLFPNSKVYLIPMSRKILVRGQARDSNEAAHIIRLVSGEVINQEGSLFGPQGTGILSGGIAPNTGGFGAAGYGAGAAYAAGVGGGFVGGYSGFGINGGLSAYDLAASFIINELQVPGEFQIAMRVRVAELSRTAADAAGVNINAIFAGARQVVNTAMIGATGGVAAAGTLSGTFENGEIGVLLNWLCANGTAKIVAEPTATVLSGRNVRFLSGGEFAVPTVVGLGGASGTTTSFRGFGTSLMATPTVIDRDNIRIGVIAEYSNITSQNAVSGIPGLQTRRIETVVEMREGQTMAMAGLLSHRTATSIQRIPLLGDLPAIGPLLFTSKTSTQEENELLILITPELVRPMDAHEVPPVPGFEVTKPTHHEFWKLNMSEGPPDTGYYHSAPYGSGTTGIHVDYQHFNPGPAASMQSPVLTEQTPPPPPVGGPLSGPTMNRQRANPANHSNAANTSNASQAGGQRQSAQRSNRQQESQVLPTENTDVRQTNFSAPSKNGRDRRSQKNYSTR